MDARIRQLAKQLLDGITDAPSLDECLEAYTLAADMLGAQVSEEDAEAFAQDHAH